MFDLQPIDNTTKDKKPMLKRFETISYFTRLSASVIVIFTFTIVGLLIYSIISDPIARLKFVEVVVTQFSQIIIKGIQLLSA